MQPIEIVNSHVVLGLRDALEYNSCFPTCCIPITETTMQIRRFIQLAILLTAMAPSLYSDDASRPNVIVVITDDQGYGDLAFTGNPAIKTPAIEVERDGDYEISLRRWPVEADKGINDGTYGKAFNYQQARLRIGGVDEPQDIPEGAKEVTFKVTLKKGITELAPVFIGPDLTATPYYAYVTHQPKTDWQTPLGMGIPVYDPSYGRVPPQTKKGKPQANNIKKKRAKK